jgi:hypothetical protein
MLADNFEELADKAFRGPIGHGNTAARPGDAGHFSND